MQFVDWGKMVATKLEKNAASKGTAIVPLHPKLGDHLATDRSFPSAYLRAVGGIAAADGSVNLPEYAALNHIVSLTEESALAGVMLVHSLEHPRALKVVLSELRQASAGVDEVVRKAAFDAARDLLLLQGEQSREIAKRFAEALDYRISEVELGEFPSKDGPTVWNTVARRSMRLIKRRDLIDLADQCIRVTGDPEVATLVGDFLDGRIEPATLTMRIAHACDAVSGQLTEFERRLTEAELVEVTASKFVSTAEQLHKQISQRLAVTESRIEFERQAFTEDIADAIHDAGDTIELEIADRLKTDKWKLEQVWESIGRTQFGKELARRTDRIVSRREEILRLLKEDLRLFQEEIQFSRSSILDRQHHSNFSKLMPPLRVTTKVLNAVDTAAEFTLGAGALSIAGAGTAAYFLGTAAVLPVIAPAVPFIGGAIVVAGLFKWLSDSDQRKTEEIRNKREAFEAAMRAQMEKAQESFNNQLDVVSQEFRETALQILQPLMLEADAAKDLTGRQVRLAKRLILESRLGIAKLVLESSKIGSA